MRKVFIVQRPRNDADFDMEPLLKLGEIEYLLPAAPNLHDQTRITEDVKHLTMRLHEFGPNDILVILGGSPISSFITGIAYAYAGCGRVFYGLYSRGRDQDGRRGAVAGSYQLVPVDFGLDDDQLPPLATAVGGRHD